MGNRPVLSMKCLCVRSNLVYILCVGIGSIGGKVSASARDVDGAVATGGFRRFVVLACLIEVAERGSDCVRLVATNLLNCKLRQTVQISSCRCFDESRYSRGTQGSVIKLNKLTIVFMVNYS